MRSPLSHLDDDQTELTLQQEKEALADAVGCVSRLERVQPKGILVQKCDTPPSDLLRVCECWCVPNLLYELDHADAVSLVEGDGTAQTVELSREPQRRQTLSVSVKSSSGGIAECLPRTLRRVQRVQSDAVEGGDWKFTIRIMLP